MANPEGTVPYPRFCEAGDTALMVELGAGIDRDTNAAVMRLNARLRKANLPGVIETLPTFRSILVTYDVIDTTGETIEAAITDLLDDDAEAKKEAARTWRLPVCYDGDDMAPDLSDVADRTGFTPEEVIKRHLDRTYSIYMLGTFPGFGFMGDVDEKLALPRRDNPRVAIPQGSVGITGKLTAIYPIESPGGWNLIGRSPVVLFDPSSEKPALLSPGDAVTFERIDRTEFDQVFSAARDGRWLPEPL